MLQPFSSLPRVEDSFRAECQSGKLRLSTDLPLLREPVLHLPNIMDVAGASSFEGLATYMLRSVVLVGANQFLVLPRCQREQALELLTYYQTLGLTRADERNLVFCAAAPDEHFTAALLDDAAMRSTLRRLPVARIEPFVATHRVRALAEDLGLHLDMAPEVAEVLNHKAHARRCFAQRGVATPGTRLVRREPGSDFEATVLGELEVLFAAGHATCALTLPSSFSGIGIRRVESPHEAARVLREHLAEAEELLVEPWLDGVTASPSFVLYLGDDERADRVISTSEQWLMDDPARGPRHFGNRLPASRDLSPVIEQAAEVLRDVGVRGIVGVDLIARGHTLSVTEVNARQTGAIFGALTALRALAGDGLPTCVVHNNVPVPVGCTLARYLAHLRTQGLAYDPEARRGVIVISHGSMAAGKVMVVALGCDFQSHEQLVERIGLLQA